MRGSRPVEWRMVKNSSGMPASREPRSLFDRTKDGYTALDLYRLLYSLDYHKTGFLRAELKQVKQYFVKTDNVSVKSVYPISSHAIGLLFDSTLTTLDYLSLRPLHYNLLSFQIFWLHKIHKS